MESKITFESEGVTLKGMINRASEQKAVVICHPHPIFGGNMDNPVVRAIARAFFNKGFTTLRFNFRLFCNGRDEQADVLAALNCLEQMGFEDQYLSGYSFGAMVNAMVVSKGCLVQDHVMVSPPVYLMNFDEIERIPNTGLIVTGDWDLFAPERVIRRHIERWGGEPLFTILTGCDHFYSGRLGNLQDTIEAYLA